MWFKKKEVKAKEIVALERAVAKHAKQVNKQVAMIEAIERKVFA